MDALKIPTDNLYKFIAITGLFLITLSVVLPQILLDKILTKHFEVETAHVQLARSMAASEIKSAQAEAMIKISQLKIDAYKNNSELDLYKFEELLANQFELISSETDRLSGLAREIDSEKISHDYFIDILNRAKGQIKLYEMMSIAGLFLSVTGFILWYLKLQRHLDFLLEKKIK